MNVKKTGVLSIILGIIMILIWNWLTEHSSPYAYWGKSDFTQTIMEITPIFCMGLGIISIIMGVISIINQSSVDKKELITRFGKIIEKQPGIYSILSVEFENGTRERLVLPGNIIVSVGDEGYISTRGNQVVSFQKGKEHIKCYCTNCGTEIQSTDIFCNECGTRI